MVLAIILVIAIPKIGNVIENAKEGAFQSSSYGVVKAANYYCVNKRFTDSDYNGSEFTLNNGKLKSEEEELPVSDIYLEGNSFVNVDEECNVQMSITDGKYYATKEYDEVGILVTLSEESAFTREELSQRMIELEEMVASLTDKDNSNNSMLKTYSIGSIYITINNTNPSEIIGGTWEAFGSGKTIVGVNTSETEFNTVEKTGGEKTHTLTIAEIPEHTHSFTSSTVVASSTHKHLSPIGQLRDGSHQISLYQTFGAVYYPENYTTDGYLHYWSFSEYAAGNYTTTADKRLRHYYTSVPTTSGTPPNLTGGTTTVSGTTNSAGSNSSHNNLQPYITVYMWKRTA